ncbi:hypothetical protein TNCV_3759301 [Trichonephila clavipes]|nr:hypothetical protein TNCV_3759301 [Trichonephila clavipes]
MSKRRWSCGHHGRVWAEPLQDSNSPGRPIERRTIVLSVRLRRSRQFFLFSPIRTWTADREPGVCEFFGL